jgi:hypothetical protein
MNETIISNAPPEIPPNDVPLTPPEEKKGSKTWLIVVIVLLVLCCCCVCLSATGAALWSNGDRWFNLGQALQSLLGAV